MFRLLKWGARLLALIVILLLAGRAYSTRSGPPLELWHTYIPHELTAQEIDKSDWAQYLAAEDKVFAEVRAQVTDKLPEEARHAGNRYFSGSPIYPDKFVKDWNRWVPGVWLEPTRPCTDRLFQGMNRRHFLGAGCAASVLASGCDLSFRDGVFNDCRAELPADLRDHPLVQPAWRGLDAAKASHGDARHHLDHHVHG